MTCDDVERLIEAYADGELELERAVDVETHLAGCPACTARFERARALTEQSHCNVCHRPDFSGQQTVPLVIMTLSRALRERFDAHKRIARWTWPAWMYVSVTGVLIYWLLYVRFPQPS